VTDETENKETKDPDQPEQAERPEERIEPEDVGFKPKRNAEELEKEEEKKA
jgi:hypothetical protein